MRVSACAKRHRRLGIAFLGFVKAHGIDARHDIVAQIRGFETPRLQRLDDLFRARIDFQQPRGVAFAFAQARGQRALTETVDFLEKRAVGAAGKSRRLLIHDAERQEFGGFEFRRVLRLLRGAVTFGETARHADHFEAAIAQVVRFFGVEGQNAIGQRLVGRDQDGNLFQAENFSGGQSMAAVRRP